MKPTYASHIAPIILLVLLTFLLFIALFWGIFAKYEHKKHILPLISTMYLIGLGFIVYIFI